MTESEYEQRNLLGYEGDKYIHLELKALVDKFQINQIFETGTYLGGTTKRLAEFAPVTTIEISDEYFYKANHNNFGHMEDASKITSLLGNSPEVLAAELNKNEYTNVLFFLDAHWGDVCPLIEELEQIADAKLLNPVIAIHDFKVPERSDLGFDSYKGQEFTYEWIKPNLDNIYGVGQYDYHYNNSAEGAQRGVIYIYPKTKIEPRKKRPRRK